jgi:predicted amidohydrolase YtcJ
MKVGHALGLLGAYAVPLVLVGLGNTVMSGCATTAGRGALGAPWRVLEGPSFVTGWAGDVPETTDALVIDRDGRIVAIGAAAAPAHLPRWTLPGQLAVPGFGDAHVHLHWLGQGAELARLREVGDLDAVRAEVSRVANAHPEVPVVRGHGWDDRVGVEALHAATLAGLDPAGRPIVLTRADGHALWLDAVALARLDAAGLLVDGAEGSAQIVHRDATGAPTGLIADPALGTFNALADPPGPTLTERRFLRALEALGAAGVVEVHDMATRAVNLAPLAAALARLGPRAPRVVAYLEDAPASWDFFETHAPGPVQLAPGLLVQGVKLFADGALGSRGAALLAPYADAPATSGAAIDRATLEAAAVRAVGLGFDVAIHTIGDAAVVAAVDVFERALAAPGPHPPAARRLRLEHAQVVPDRLLPRLAALGLVASVQPIHAVADADMAPARLGAARLLTAYRARTLLDAGVRVAFGSDAPIEAFDPLLTLRAATERGGEGAADWLRAEGVSLGEALRAMSAGLSVARGRPATALEVGAPVCLTLLGSDTDGDRFEVKGFGLAGFRAVGRVVTTPGKGAELVVPSE